MLDRREFLISLGCLASSGCIMDSCDKNPLQPSATGDSAAENSSYKGPEVWIHPNVGPEDNPKMITNPELWPIALNTITTFQFHHAHLLREFNPMTRGNTLDKFIEVDAFRFLTKRGKKISFEAGALKHHGGRCGDTVPELIGKALESINSVQSNGGIVSSISVDWAFGAVADGCDLTDEEVGKFIAQYIRGVNGPHPHVAIGLTEGYPAWPPERMEAMLDAVIGAGAHPAFVHIDYDREGVQRSGPDPENSHGYNPDQDIPRLRSVVRSRKMKFGIILFAGDGNSSEAFSAGVHYGSRQILNASGGDLDRIIFESWSDVRSGNSQTMTNDRFFPLNLPETTPGRMTHLLNTETARWRR